MFFFIILTILCIIIQQCCSKVLKYYVISCKRFRSFSKYFYSKLIYIKKLSLTFASSFRDNDK